MRLKKNQKAPEFKVNDIWGNEVNLRNMANEKIFLSFHRYAECALCNLRISEIMRNKQKFTEYGIVPIVIFESPAESLRKSIAERHQFNFTIIADPERKLYDLYKVKPSWLGTFRTMSVGGIAEIIKASKMGFKPLGKMEGKMNQLPADFLINKNLLLEEVYYSKSVNDKMPIDSIFRR